VTYTKAAGFSRTTKLLPTGNVPSEPRPAPLQVAISGSKAYVVLGGNDGNGNGVLLASPRRAAGKPPQRPVVWAFSHFA